METINFGSIVIDPRLVICQTKKISIVLNLFQTRCGLALMAIPRDGRPLVEWSQEKRESFFGEAERGFSQMGFSPEKEFRELLLNQGSLVGQTIPHPHLHCFMGYDEPLLNWGKEGPPSSLSPIPFTGELCSEEQYNLYKKGTGPWLLVSRGNSPKLEDNPKRGTPYPIIVDGKLLPEWEEKIESLRQVYHMP